MDENEILASSLSKTEKARQLFDLGKTNKEVADLVLKGNAGWAFNIRKAYNEKKLRQKAPATTEKAGSKAAQGKPSVQPISQGAAKSRQVTASASQKAPAKTIAKPKAAIKTALKKPAVKKAAAAAKAGKSSKGKTKKGMRH